MKTYLKVLAVSAAIIAMTPSAYAAPTVYFGENLTPTPAATVGGAPVTARNTFASQLSGVSTEDFEGLPGGAPPASLTFAGSAGPIVATFSPSSGIICTTNGCGGSGRFATSGHNYFDVSSTFSASFSTPIAAFGFYGTDIGDISGSLTITLIHASGPNTMLTVANTINAPDGSLLFWGVIDTANPFTGISFGNTAAGDDFFGFDDIIVGDVRQVTGGVPEPTTWAMMMLGFGMMGWALRRRAEYKVRVRFA
jgi:hypothetical protein